jgi:hypothetical protein
MCSAVVLRRQLGMHSCHVRPVPMPHLGPAPRDEGDFNLPKYVRRSPGASPQVRALACTGAGSAPCRILILYGLVVV